MNDRLTVFDAPRKALGGESLAEVLERLVARTAAARTAPIRQPLVSVLLSGGREFSGTPLSLSARNPRILTMASQDGRIAFLELGSVIGIVLEEAGSFGQPVPGLEIPFRLALARQAQALGQAHGVPCTVEVGEDPIGRLVVHTLLGHLEEALAALLVDDAGREAFGRQVQALAVSAGGEVQLEGGRLEISAPSLERLPDGPRLRAEIEALL